MVEDKIQEIAKRYGSRLITQHTHDETMTRTLVLLHAGTRKNIRIAEAIRPFEIVGEKWIYQFEDRKE